jgi:dipeptidyl aminopeptidase/acylaminoacyl peptidase
VQLDGGAVYWAESRPEEGGRTQLVRWEPGKGAVDVLPHGANVRTAVHEYGGGAWWVRDGLVWFAEWTDQRLHTVDAASPERATPVPVTPEPATPRGDRWADGDLDPSGRWIVAVRERHGEEVANELVVLDTEGTLAPRVLVTGPDFVSDPRFSPDGRWLCWLQWNHPDMPWDGTELCVAGLRHSDIGPGLTRPTVIAGQGTQPGPGESVTQPRWAHDGSLWFSSDRTGWWNLYRWTPGDLPGAAGSVEPTVQMEAEIGGPQWVFGQSTYALLDDQRVIFAYTSGGFDHLAVQAADGTVHDLDLPYTAVRTLRADGEHVVLVASSPTAEAAVVRLQLDGPRLAGRPEVLRPPRDLGVDPSWFSVPEAISFPSTGGRTAHALFYPPTNPEVSGPAGKQPPLLVLIHGGPTAAARPELQLGTQYWTSRGFGVVDVNHGGSTGYGRPYRDLLLGTWGVVDLDDCEAAARWLAAQGRADPQRLCIRGGSAGGYTTLAALAFRDTFAAGADYYGIADLEALAKETHKFESRYLDGLIGPYPAARHVYVERSPIHHLEGFDRPLVVFQGLEDEVVPPDQSEMIVEALRKKGVPVAYLAFEGEQHGFRAAATQRRTLDAELSFYGQVFGFDLPPDEAIDPIDIENLKTG